MLQKEDLAHQSDQPVLNTPKWPKRLTIILTSVLLLTMFGLGGYWLGARRQQSSPTDLITEPKPSRLPTATPIQQHSANPTIATRRTESIANWLTFTDSSNHYSFLYPPNWRLNAWTGGGVVELYSWPATEERKEIIPQSEKYIIIHVFENPRRLTIEQWFDARWGSSRDKSYEQVVSINEPVPKFSTRESSPG
jgi:hypothetical protein